MPLRFRSTLINAWSVRPNDVRKSKTSWHGCRRLLFTPLFWRRTGLAGSAWLSYKRAFRRQGAAYKLTDWPNMNSALFNFCVSGGSAVGQPTSVSSTSSSPTVLSGSPAVPEPRDPFLHGQFAIPGTMADAPRGFYGAVFAICAIFRAA